ncbi:GntR family transcriptional regulator [Actinacidiphila glaucinigra]|uniref:GntR family transcriptional regulator n=1 Tax=Actinacidiphila glaucinigra TaxID=235986 RepID=UPI00386E1B4E
MIVRQKTSLYRCYGARGDLLYVGIASDPEERWQWHQRWSKAWAPLVVRRVTEWHGTRDAALTAEQMAIRNEKPEFINVYNFGFAPFTCFEWPSLAELNRGRSERLASLICAEIDSGRWVEGQRIPSAHAMADAVGVSIANAQHATRLLVRKEVLILRRGAGIFVA